MTLIGCLWLAGTIPYALEFEVRPHHPIPWSKRRKRLLWSIPGVIIVAIGYLLK